MSLYGADPTIVGISTVAQIVAQANEFWAFSCKIMRESWNEFLKNDWERPRAPKSRFVVFLPGPGSPAETVRR